MPNFGQPLAAQTSSPTSTPILMLENNYRQLQDWGQRQEQELLSLGLDPEMYNEKLQKLQTDYDKRRADIETNMRTVQQTQNWIDSGIIDAATGNKLKWGAVVPKEALDMMFPEPEGEPKTARRPFTPGQLEAFQPGIKAYQKAAEKVDVPGFWDRRTHATLLKQYKTWQINIGYGKLDAWEQRQADVGWDAWARNTYEEAGWNPLAQEVRALRAKGPISRGYTDRFRGTPTGPREAGDPLKDNISTALRRRRPGLQFIDKSTEAQPEPEPAKLSDKDRAAISWARQNPEDPRAIKILTLHGVQ